jgi:hypothetical protein
MAEILLKVALNPTNQSIKLVQEEALVDLLKKYPCKFYATSMHS